MKLMLRSLLEERFHLVLRRGTKELPVYSLVVAKGGPRIKESMDGPLVAPAPPNAPGGSAASPPPGMAMDRDGLPNFPEGGPGGLAFGLKDGHFRMKASKQPLAQLTKVLGNRLGRPIVDDTGLTGKYDFRLDFVPEDLSSAPASNPEPAVAEPGAAADLFGALQEQLGLKLRPAKGPVEVLIVDHAERTPTQN